MLKDRIYFKNAHALIYEGGLGELTDPDKMSFMIGDTLHRWEVYRVKDILICANRTIRERKELPRLVEILRNYNFQGSVIPIEEMLESSPEECHRINRYILSRAKVNRTLLLYPNSEEEQFNSYLTTIPIEAQKKRLAPETAIRLITGRTYYKESDKRAFTYKKFVQPDYSPPSYSEQESFFDYLKNEKDENLLIKSDHNETVLKNKSSTLKHPAIAKSESPKESDAGTEQESGDLFLTTNMRNEESSPKEEMKLQNDNPDILEGSLQEREDTALTPVPLKTSGMTSDEMRKNVFKQSRITIKVKMLAMITGIIVLALGSMIFLATIFFQKASERNVQTNNLTLAEVIGYKIEADILSNEYKSRLLLNVYDNERQPHLRAQFADTFFQNNSDFVFIGVLRRGNNFRLKLYNNTFLLNNGFDTNQIDAVYKNLAASFTPSYSGSVVVENASQNFPTPLIAMSIPVVKGGGNEIIVAYIDPASMVKTFQLEAASEEIVTFMVNSMGDVISHPDTKLIFEKVNLSKLTIVKSMMESAVQAKQIRYTDNGKVYLGSFKKLTIAGLGIITTLPEHTAFQEVYNIQERNLIILGIILILAVIIVFFYARTISVPLVKLVGATHKIEKGDFAVNVENKTKDEIGVLTHSFNTMAKGLEERERMKDAFGKFVNKEIAERALRGELSLGGEHKECAVFFSDLRGFTAMSEKMSPVQVVEFLNVYFTDMVACVNATNGVVDKFIGDAIMAHWGAIASYGNDTENAVNTALMMRKALFELNKRNEGSDKPKAMFGCGINTGPVISGQIGSNERLEFTVIGDAVNLASRIESLNKPFGSDILISQDSYNLVKDIFKVEKMPPIKVKGKTEPQTIYAVIGRFDDPDAPKNIREVRKLAGIQFDAKKAEKSPDQEEVKYEIIEK